MKSNKRFIPTLVFFAFIIIAISVAAFCITSSAKDENKYYSPTGLEIHGAIPIERTEWFDFTEWSDEVKADGETDMTQMLQDCVNAHDNILLPSGRYYIAGTVTLRDGSGIKGEDGTVIVNDNNDIFFACGSYDGDSGILDHASDISIIGLTVKSTATERSFLFNSYSVKNVEIRNIHLEGCGILQVLSNVPDIWDLPRDEENEYIKLLSQNVTVSDCFCDGIDCEFREIHCSHNSVPVGIQTENLYDFIIENTEICRMTHGIQYFGSYCYLGSDAEYDEFIMKSGKFGRGILTGSYIHNISGGGIWGFTSEDFLITDTVFETVHDVSADYENCNNILITRCRFIDGPVGGSQAIMGNITYRDNEFIMNADYDRAMFNIRGSTDSSRSWERQKLVFENNTFIAYGDKIGTINATHYQNAAIGNFTVQNNKLVNTVIRSCSYYPSESPVIDRTENADIGHLYIKGNDFTFTNLPKGAANPAAIYATAGVNTLPFTDIVIVNNTFDADFNDAFDAINVNNDTTHDGYRAVISGNIAKKGNIRLLNNVTSNDGDVLCSAVIENNICDGFAVEGDVSFIVKGNTDTNGNAVTADDMAITALFTSPSKSAINTVDCPKIADYLTVGITGYSNAIWNGSGEYRLTKQFADGEKNTVFGSFKALWSDEGDGIKLCFLVKMSKGEKLTTKDNTVFRFSLDGKNLDGTAIIRTSGTVKAAEGIMFDKGTKVSAIPVFGDEYRHIDMLVTIKIPKTVIGERDKIFFNLAECENSKCTTGVGFVCAAGETDASKFAVLNLRDGITRISFGNEQAGDVNGDCRISRADLTLAKEFFDGYNPENGLFKTSVACGIDVNGDGKLDGDDITALEALVGDALSGDVNGDSKIKGNDSTLLLKYLAGWSVSIEEANADCNGDGKIKGNDSTLLLKYLAGWDVSLG